MGAPHENPKDEFSKKSSLPKTNNFPKIVISKGRIRKKITKRRFPKKNINTIFPKRIFLMSPSRKERKVEYMDIWNSSFSDVLFLNFL